MLHRRPGGERGIRRAAGAALLPLGPGGPRALRRQMLGAFARLRAPNGVRIRATPADTRAARARDFYRPGGERGIRTPGTFARPTVFKTAAFNRSAISPCPVIIASMMRSRDENARPYTAKTRVTMVFAMVMSSSSPARLWPDFHHFSSKRTMPPAANSDAAASETGLLALSSCRAR